MNTNIKYQFNYWLAIGFDNLIAHNGIYVLGYTKTGTNWMCNLISNYYNIPKQESCSFYQKSIHHIHRFLPFPYYKKNLIYMTRDGRDAIVSRYFSMVNQSTQRYTKTDFQSFCGKKPTKENIKELLPKFIEFLKSYHKSSIDYKSHNKRAIENGFFIIKYEDLLSDTENTLKKVVQHLGTNKEIIDEDIKEVVDYCSFEQSKKRNNNNKGFFRKDGGKSGNWKNYFNTESASMFCDYANEILIHFGYEKDANWVKDFD